MLFSRPAPLAAHDAQEGLLLLQVCDYSAPSHLSSRSAYMSRSVGALSLQAYLPLHGLVRPR